MSNIDMPVNQQVERALPDGEYLELPEQWTSDLQKIVQRTESPSSIRSFLSCPLRWYLERYSDLPSEPTGFPGVVGTFAHRVLEVFYSEPQDLRDAKLLRRTFHNAWNAIKQSSGSGIIPPGLQEDFRILEENASNPDGMRGSFYRKTRDAVMATLDFDDDPGDIKVLGTETWVKLKRHNVLLRGKIDRIVESRSGGESIQDYKTGRPPSEDEPVDVLSDTYVPVGLYALMRKLGNDSLGARAVANVQLLYLSNYLKYTIKVKPEVLEKTSSLLDRVIEMMDETVRTGTIPITPSESPSTGQCTWCPASGVCPVWTGSSSFDQMREELSI